MPQGQDQLSHDQPVDSTETTEKQPYSSPELWEFGSVEVLTRTSTSGVALDGGGTFPNIYIGTA